MENTSRYSRGNYIVTDTPVERSVLYEETALIMSESRLIRVKGPKKLEKISVLTVIPALFGLTLTLQRCKNHTHEKYLLSLDYPLCLILRKYE